MSLTADSTPRCIIVLDEVRTSSLDFFGCLSSYQWEGSLRPKLLEAGFRLDSVSVLTLSAIQTRPDLLDGSNLIVGLGEAPLQFFTSRKGIDKWHLSPLETHCGRKFIGSFGFDRLQGQYELNLYLKLTLRRAFEEFSLPLPYRRAPERFLLNPDLETTFETLRALESAREIAVDVETGYGQINTVGFAWSESDAIAINVLPDRCSADTYYELWNAIARVLQRGSRKVFQNHLYDVSYFSAYGIRVGGDVFDTMWAMKVLWPELDMGLGNVGRIYTRRAYWKDDGKVEAEEGKKKDWGNVRDWVKHYTYNCLSRDMRVLTEKGPIAIGSIARKKMKLKVLSLNEKTQKSEWKPITNWLVKREGRNINWVRIATAGSGNKKGLFVTPDHRVLTFGSGWKEARDVHAGDILVRRGIGHCAGTVMGTVLGDSSFGKSASATVKTLVTSQVNEELVNLKRDLFGGTVSKKFKTTGYGSNWFYDLYVPVSEQFLSLSKLSLVETLPLLTPMGIALWFMDDGCKQKAEHSPHMKLALQSYSSEERTLILDFFRQRYAEKASLDRAGSLSLSTKMSQKLCAELGQYFVPSLRYKMSHAGPEFCFEQCMAFKSAETEVLTEVVGVSRETKKKRGYSTSYCISVEGNHNFFTEYGVVANCRDTTGTFEAAQAQRNDLRSRGLDEFFNSSILSLSRPLLEMCGNGFPLDLERREVLRAETEARIGALTERLKGEVGYDLNPRSPAQKLKYLKSIPGVKIPKKYDKEKGVYRETADSAALRKILLAKPELSALRTLGDIASLDKALSSYINFDVKEGDERVRYSLGKFTETLRLAGGTDPWDRGFNIQTIPREGGDVSIKSMLAAPAGQSFVEVDLRQAESRFVAYRAPEPKLIDMLESGEDVHKHVAYEILKGLGKPASEYSKDWRQLGKKSGHGANYMMKAKTFVDSCFNEMDVVLTKKEAQVILDAYYGLFPGIPRWHKEIDQTLYRTRKLTAPTGWARYFYGRPGSDMLREAVAWEPQHTIPWLTNRLMFHLIDERRRGNLKFRLLAQVHDALYMLVPDEWVARVIAVCLRHKDWQTGIDLPGGRLFIPAEAKAGKRLSEMVDHG